MKVTKIILEDKGQDFLELYVDHTGRVIEALPFQSSVWVGAYIPVNTFDMVQVGRPCPIHNPPHIEFGFLKYSIEKIEQVELPE
jgi:hypothetical protein